MIQPSLMPDVPPITSSFSSSDSPLAPQTVLANPREFEIVRYIARKTVRAKEIFQAVRRTTDNQKLFLGASAEALTGGLPGGLARIAGG